MLDIPKTHGAITLYQHNDDARCNTLDGSTCVMANLDVLQKKHGTCSSICTYTYLCVCVRVPVYVTHETTKQCWRCHEICNARQNLPVLSATGPRPFLAVPAPRGGKFAANLWVLSASKCLKKVVQDFPEKNLENTMIRFRILEQLFLDFRGKSDRSSIAIMGVEPT